MQVFRLAAEGGARRREGGAVGGDAQDGDGARAEAGYRPGEYPGTFGQFGGAELIGARGRPLDQAGDADAAAQEVVPVGRGEPGGGVDQVVGDAGPQQGRVEPVAARREVALHGDAAQAGVDADEQQPDALGDQVRQGGSGGRLQLGLGVADLFGVPGGPQADRPLP